MAIRVIQGKVNNGIQLFSTGEVISGLSEEEESRLVSMGVAEVVLVIKEDGQTNAEDNDGQEPESQVDSGDTGEEHGTENGDPENLEAQMLELNPDEYIAASNKTSKQKK